MQVARDETKSGIFQFLSIAILLALCSLLPTLINFGITNTPIQKIWENDFGFQLFLKGVIYIWLLLLALFPLLSKPISVAKIFIIAILLYFLLRFPHIIESRSLKSTIPYSVMSILGPASIYVATLVVAKLLHWQEESSNTPNELPAVSPPFSMLLRKFIYAAIFPILLMSIIPAIIALQAFMSEPLYAIYLMVPASSVLHYWPFGFVALLGIAIASFENFRRWSIYYAVTCATVPIVTKYQSLKFPEGKLIVLSYLLVSVLILMWAYFFNRWARVETRASFAE